MTIHSTTLRLVLMLLTFAFGAWGVIGNALSLLLLRRRGVPAPSRLWGIPFYSPSLYLGERAIVGSRSLDLVIFSSHVSTVLALVGFLLVFPLGFCP